MEVIRNYEHMMCLLPSLSDGQMISIRLQAYIACSHSSQAALLALPFVELCRCFIAAYTISLHPFTKAMVGGEVLATL